MALIQNICYQFDAAIKLVLFIYVAGLAFGFFWGVLQENYSCEKNESPDYSIVLQHFTLIYKEFFDFLIIRI